MSGPKTSALDLERQTRQRMERARRDAANAAAAFEGLMAALAPRNTVLAGQSASGRAALGRIQAVLDTANSQFNRASAEALAATDLDEMERLCADLDQVVRRLAGQARTSIEPLQNALDEAADDVARQAAETALNAAVTEERDAILGSLAQVAARLRATQAAGRQTAATVAQESDQPDFQARFGAMLEFVAEGIASPATLDGDLVTLTAFATVGQACAAGDAEQAEATTLLAQFEILKPSIEQRRRTVEGILARIEQLEAILGADAPVRPSFADLNQVLAHQEALEAYHAQVQQRRYIRAAIDTIMARHGYDVARSVEMNLASQGDHLLFTGSGRNQGVHAFMADNGDMMLEVVGIGSPVAGKAGTAQLSASVPEERQGELLDAQTEFCSVYAQIEDELKEFGIVNAVRYKAAPDLRHCKEIHLADETRASQSAPAAQTVGGQDRRRDAVQSRAREMR